MALPSTHAPALAFALAFPFGVASYLGAAACALAFAFGDASRGDFVRGDFSRGALGDFCMWT